VSDKSKGIINAMLKCHAKKEILKIHFKRKGKTGMVYYLLFRCEACLH